MGKWSLLLLICAACAVFAADDPPKKARKELEAGQLLAPRKPDEARRRFEAALAIHPTYARAWFELGRVQARTHQSSAAEESFEKALQFDPNLLTAYLNLAALARNSGDWKRVVELTTQMTKSGEKERHPQLAVAYLECASAQYNLGDYAAASISAARGMRWDGDQRITRLRMIRGLAEAASGKLRTARSWLREYLADEPDAPDSAGVKKVLAAVEARFAAPRLTARAGILASAPAESNDASGEGLVFSVETRMVAVHFGVSRDGQPVKGLTANDIQVLEDGVPQQLSYFQGGSVDAVTQPVEISLLFDCSTSVSATDGLKPYVFQEGLLDEFETASIAISGFSTESMRFGPTRRPAELQKAMDSVRSLKPGITPLFGAVIEAIRTASRSRNAAQLLVVVSDGISNAEGGADLKKWPKAAEAAMAAGIPVYAVVLPNNEQYPHKAESVASFKELAAATGGRAISVDAAEKPVERLLHELALDLGTGYVAGYSVTSAAEGEPQKERQVQVVLNRDEVGKLAGGKRTILR